MRDPASAGTLSPDEFRRVRQVFEEALEQAAAERHAFVEHQCAGEPALRAEVERMLAAEAGASYALIDHGVVAPAARGHKSNEPMSCPSCGTHLAAPHRFCPACGTPVAADGIEGRFRAGALFANRFRIVSTLGRGGMGEVYRAHDLELGQPVALKLLTALRTDEAARARLRNEVRLARQLSHANVCRVYDIGEAHGELYLSMEYVDGEDLAALLKRIGRLPVDKGIEVARKLCAGLAAAHAKGVLHRDFKPANIMIDGAGEVRIMDFGLATVASELDAKDLRSGTPAYMAPEQLAGREATVQSDLYALGLVLYELFTGKTPFNGKGIEELQRQRESHPSTAPAALIPDLGPRIERAILRCLEPDPKLRPASALEVSASLPGGDPLAEALAAGETPSPEMVAASGSHETMNSVVAAALLATAFICLGVVLWLTPRFEVVGARSLNLPPEELRIRARAIARSLGYTQPPADWDVAFDYDRAYPAKVGAGGRRLSGTTVDEALRTTPSPVRFTYQQSPRPLIRSLQVTGLSARAPFAPAAAGAGLIVVDVDPDGRLRRFVGIPEASAPLGASTTDWDQAFKAAGLDRASFLPVEAHVRTPIADTALAWTGHYPGYSNVPVRIEAASLRGRVTMFAVSLPWSRPPEGFPDAPTRSGPTAVADAIMTLVFILLALAAWWHWRLGRADPRSAWRLGLYTASIAGVVGVLAGVAPATAPLTGLIFATAYLGVEPWARRLWPHAMVTWARVLAGRLRDPRVGRDLLVAAACVSFNYALQRCLQWAMDWSLDPGGVDPTSEAKFGNVLDNLLGGRVMVATMVTPMLAGVAVALYFFAVFFLAKIVFKRTWLASAVYLVFWGLVYGLPRVALGDWTGATQWVLELSFLLLLTLRFGLFATSVFSALSMLIDWSIVTYDFGAWYGQSSLVATAVLVAVALYGFYAALGGRPLAWLAADQTA